MRRCGRVTLSYSSGTHRKAASLALGRTIEVQRRERRFVNVYREGARERSYDLDRRTGDFVVTMPAQEVSSRLVVVLNWFTVLRRRMAAGEHAK